MSKPKRILISFDFKVWHGLGEMWPHGNLLKPSVLRTVWLLSNLYKDLAFSKKYGHNMKMRKDNDFKTDHKASQDSVLKKK